MRTTAQIALALAVFLQGSLNSRSQTAPAAPPSEEDNPPAWRLKPPDPQVADPRSPAELSSLGEYFDFGAGASDPLDGPPSGMTHYSSAYQESDYGDFPVDRDEVVVAHFSTWTSRLSDSHLSIYTTVNLQIDRVVTDKSGTLAGGLTIPLSIPGGTIRLPGTERTISHFVRLRDFPLEPNTKYLIFLSYRPMEGPLQAGVRPIPLFYFFEYVKAWKVDQDVLTPLTRFDRARASQGKPSHVRASLESAISELTSH
jgi:hypothetical protein